MSFIIYAPAGTPAALIQQLHSGFAKALKQAKVVATLAGKARSAAIALERIGLRLD